MLAGFVKCSSGTEQLTAILTAIRNVGVANFLKVNPINGGLDVIAHMGDSALWYRVLQLRVPGGTAALAIAVI